MAVSHWDNDTMQGEVYLAGERVPSGNYRQIGTRRRIFLPHEDYLPASLDGRVAVYERIDHTWNQIRQRHEQRTDIPQRPPKR
ncbi:MAG TPA: hypothetical protein VFA07_13930 [Chthonomonadaceae bacterium]|nr:hypothetical protein [Chthonomonadaceae bacterium]